MEPGMNSKPPAYITWISSLRFGVRSWVKYFQSRTWSQCHPEKLPDNYSSAFLEYWVWTSSKALVGTIMPTLLLVVLVGEIFQNDLNFSLEKYLSWQKRTDLQNLWVWSIWIPHSSKYLWGRTAQKPPPKHPNLLVSTSHLLRLFCTFQVVKTGPQSAKNQKEDASCASWRVPTRKVVFQVMAVPQGCCCWR